MKGLFGERAEVRERWTTTKQNQCSSIWTISTSLVISGHLVEVVDGRWAICIHKQFRQRCGQQNALCCFREVHRCLLCAHE